jgi:hypothetical protein
MKQQERENIDNLLKLYFGQQITLQELYDNSVTTELADKWEMSVPTLTKKLKKEGVKLKGRAKEKQIPI